MEEKTIEEILKNFDPVLSEDSRFMSRLESNLEAVDSIRQHNLGVISRNRKAVAIAAVVGFLSGLIFSMSLPLIGAWIENFLSIVASGALTTFLIDNPRPVALLIIVVASAFIAVNTYELSIYCINKEYRTP